MQLSNCCGAYIDTFFVFGGESPLRECRACKKACLKDTEEPGECRCRKNRICWAAARAEIDVCTCKCHKKPEELKCYGGGTDCIVKCSKCSGEWGSQELDHGLCPKCKPGTPDKCDHLPNIYCSKCGNYFHPNSYTKSEINERMKAILELIAGAKNGNYMEHAIKLFETRFLPPPLPMKKTLSPKFNQCKECLQRHFDQQKASVEPSVRDRPAKTDAELLEEYFSLASGVCPFEPHGLSVSVYMSCSCTKHINERKAAIEKELGTEKILEERVRRAEGKLKDLAFEVRTQKTGIEALSFLVGGLIVAAVLFAITL